jgi:hypothetical protein
MSVVLRIILFIGLIFWFSPLRPALETELKALPKVPANALAEVDLDRIGQLIQVLDPVAAKGRDRTAEKLLVIGANIGAVAPTSAPERNASRAAEKP